MEEKRLLCIGKAVLGTLDRRRPGSPGMFEALKPVFRDLGYKNAAVYIMDDFPDRMHLECALGRRGFWPGYVAKKCRSSLFDSLRGELKDIPGVMVARLYSHRRELGAFAATVKGEPTDDDREALGILSVSLSVMAYIERVRTNMDRERREKDVFDAQSLASRLLIANTPAVPGLRTGIEHIRSLDASGDFFEFVPSRGGGLTGFIGGCNGKGRRTVMEICSIMREILRSIHGASAPSETLSRINHLLVTERRRAHQASLCVFDIDVSANRLRLAKAGRLGLLLCDADGAIANISTPGGIFLGMAANPAIPDEEYDFPPGRSLFCMTEGFYRSRSILGRPQPRWFLDALSGVLRTRRRRPLVNALFESLNAAAGALTRPPDSMLALSVERLGK